MAMSRLFETAEINGMKLSNRFVRAATHEGMAKEDGAATPKLTQIMVDLAKGGVGFIITSHMYVSPEGKAGPFQLGIYSDDLVDGLKSTCDAVHNAGGKIVAQLSHAGNSAVETAGHAPYAVSVFKENPESPRHELTKEDIKKLVQAFGDAAGRAKEAGFDGVEIHSAHGYLLNQFLSPLHNLRKDEYGGSIKNRARVHMEVYNAIREAVGRKYPVLQDQQSRLHGERAFFGRFGHGFQDARRCRSRRHRAFRRYPRFRRLIMKTTLKMGFLWKIRSWLPRCSQMPASTPSSFPAVPPIPANLAQPGSE